MIRWFFQVDGSGIIGFQPNIYIIPNTTYRMLKSNYNILTSCPGFFNRFCIYLGPLAHGDKGFWMRPTWFRTQCGYIVTKEAH